MPASVVPVLMYHHVSPTPGLITVSPQHFAAQMRWLKRHGYTTLTLDALAGFLAGEPVPDKSVVISFDDGYLDNWVYAHPVLEQYGLHAVLFLITRWLGEGPLRPHAGQGNTPLPACLSHHAGKTAIDAGQTDLVMMRWGEVLAARDAGTFEFHSHTHTHNRWDKIYPGDADNKSKALAHDLASSRNLLTERLGEVSSHLCWPQGYYDDDYIRVAEAAGFRHLYTTEPGVVGADSMASRLPRIVVKDRGLGWFAPRMWAYRQPALARWYLGRKSR